MSAYFIAHNRITDPEKMKEYLSKVVPTMLPYEPEFLVLEEHSHIIEGSTDLPRTIVIKFKSREDAKAWYDSPAYGEIRPLRLGATEGYAMIVDAYVSA